MLGIVFGSSISAPNVDHTVLGVLLQLPSSFSFIVPTTPNDGCLAQPSVVHFLFVTLTNPPLAFCSQYSAVLVPATPSDGCLAQHSVLHVLLLTSTILCLTCCAQHSTVPLPATTTAAYFSLRFCTFCYKYLPFCPRRAVHNTPPFLCPPRHARYG